MKNLMMSKQAGYKRKWKVNHGQETTCNMKFPESDHIQIPAYDVCKYSNMNDEFWNFSNVTHLDELWVYDAPTRVGIGAHLKVEKCNEELSRIAREVRSLISWSINTLDKLDDLGHLTDQDKLTYMAAPKWNKRRLNLSLLSYCHVFIDQPGTQMLHLSQWRWFQIPCRIPGV